MDDLLELDSCRSAHPIKLPPGMEQVITPLAWRVWDEALREHPDQRFQRYIVEGIRDGFRVGFNYEVGLRSSPTNVASAREHPEVVQDYLSKECSEGRVLGPLNPDELPYIHASRFGVIPKSSSNKWRLIVDLSAPDGASVNDGVDSSLTSLSYVGVEDAAEGVRSSGRGALLAKVDIKSAYRNIPVHPEDRWLLGMMWDGALFVDTVLPFGLRSVPKIFTAIADAVE